MNRRTKIMLALFAAVMGYVLVARTVYPTWIKPLLSLDERIADRQMELKRLQDLANEIEAARFEYRGYLERIAVSDAGRVETDVRDRLNALIEKHKLQSAGVIPSRAVEDRKSGLTTTLITVSAIGTLESAIGFLKDAAELPEPTRITNPVIYPAGSGRKGTEKDLVNIRIPLEVQVMPQQKVVGRIDPAGLKKPESFVRHAGRDYSPIWKATPFTEPIPLPPLRVDVQRIVTVDTGQPGVLQATPSGGDGRYTVAWSPAEGIGDPTSANTTLDTSAARTQTYTVTVTDGAESKPATAAVAVTIREPKPVEPPPVVAQPVVVDTGPKPWPDARVMQVVMTLMRSVGPDRTNELMVYNTRTRETSYYRFGDEFDGGRLVFVHQTGGLVHRKGQYFVYPLGGTLADHLESSAAADYPDLQAAAQRAVAAAAARQAELDASVKADTQARTAAEADEQAQAAAGQGAAAETQPAAQTPAANEPSGTPTAAAAAQSGPVPSAPTPQVGADSPGAPGSETPARTPDGADEGATAPQTAGQQPVPPNPSAGSGSATDGGKSEAPKQKPRLQRPTRPPKKPTDKPPGRL